MKTLLASLLILPLIALAAPPGPAQGQPAPDSDQHLDRAEKRMRLARTLGIAEALDLNDAQALQVNETLAKFDQQRLPLLRQLHDSMEILRHAANGDAAAAPQVDQAVQRLFDARTQLQSINREAFQALTKGLTPEKRARLLIFLSRFQHRFGREGAGPGEGHWQGQTGHGSGAGRGHGMGMSSGSSMGDAGCPGCDLPP